MTTDRCPACGAAVTAGAPWCTLCYADLRVPETVPPTPRPGYDAPLVQQLPPAHELPPHPILDAPVSQAPPVARTPLAAWPCLGCGAQVPLADNSCPHCGRPFLPAEELPSLALPVVGDVAQLDRAHKVVFVVGGATVVTALLVLFAFIAGSIL